MLISKAEPLTDVDLLLTLSETDISQRKELMREAQKEVEQRVKICLGPDFHPF